MQIIKIIDQKYVNRRIDVVIPLINADFSRSKIQKLIKEKRIFVNGLIIKSKYLIKLNDEIKILICHQQIKRLKAENIKLNILFEDENLLVINKPRGMVVHPGNGNYEHTLVNALLFYTKKLSNIETDSIRPGIVHRIDKETSGLLLIAKDNFTHRFLSSQLKKHIIQREYKALVSGIINEDYGTIIAPIARSKHNPLKMTVDIKNGKEAETNFYVIKRFKDATFLKIKLKQGRTHQIRVHFEYINHPIIGDCLYGKNNKNVVNTGQLLHAYKLTFIHPKNNKKFIFTTPLPQYFLNVMKLLA